jgi:hypothetical protein
MLALRRMVGRCTHASPKRTCAARSGKLSLVSLPFLPILPKFTAGLPPGGLRLSGGGHGLGGDKQPFAGTKSALPRRRRRIRDKFMRPSPTSRVPRARLQSSVGAKIFCD